MVLSNDQPSECTSYQPSHVVAVTKHSWTRTISICLLGGLFTVVAVMYGISGRTTKPSEEKILFSMRNFYFRLVFWFVSLTSVSQNHTPQSEKIIEYETFVMGGETFRMNWTVTDSKSMTFFTTNSISGIHRDSNGMPLKMPDGLHSYVLFQPTNNDKHKQYWSVNLTRIYSVVPSYTYRLQFWYTSSSASLQVMLNGVVTAHVLPSSSSVFASWISANSSTIIAQSSSLMATFAITSPLTNTKRNAIAISGIALWEMGSDRSMRVDEHGNQQTTDPTAGPTTMPVELETTDEQQQQQQSVEQKVEQQQQQSLEQQSVEQQQQQQQSVEQKQQQSVEQQQQQSVEEQQQQSFDANNRNPESSVELENLWDDNSFWWPWWWTHKPSTAPSTASPSKMPTSEKPTSQPSLQPSNQPTFQPISCPSAQPSRQPSIQPSAQPSRQPTRQPSQQPTSRPSSQPSRQPTRYYNSTYPSPSLLSLALKALHSFSQVMAHPTTSCIIPFIIQFPQFFSIPLLVLSSHCQLILVDQPTFESTPDATQCTAIKAADNASIVSA